MRSFNHCLVSKILKFNNFETSHSHHSHLNALALWFATSCGTVTPWPAALEPLAAALESHEDSIKWRLQSLLLSDVWEPYQSNQRKKLRNLKNLLEMPLSLSEDTWARLEVRDKFVAIGVRMNICRDPWGLNWGLFWDVYWITIFPLWL